MSRSFGKRAKGFSMRRGWHKTMRSRERLSVRREMTGADYGDEVFPIVKEVSNWWHQYLSLHEGRPWLDDCYTGIDQLSLKQEIRDRYFLEIRNILNGYEDRHDETFLKEFRRIKGLEPDDGQRFRFTWLNVKAVRKEIKAWPGEPLDILRHLTHNGFIEQAVRRELKMTLSK
jgi:hypothetical protein